MQVIPVIDLKKGQAVAARMGQRDHYQPLCTPLCHSAEPHHVLTRFLSLNHFKTVYLADLDAITGCGDQSHLITDLSECYPDIEFWVDRGISLSSLAADSDTNIINVIGTESQTRSQVFTMRQNYILSLDFVDEKAIGPNHFFSESQFWPQRIICMTMDRIGSNKGPDLKKLSALQATNPTRKIIAGGGVRDVHDLIELKKIGITCALVSTALHSGAITESALKKLSQNKTDA